MNRLTRVASAVVLMAPVAAVYAHGGLVEGTLWDGFSHLFASFDHLLFLAVAVVGVGLLGRRLLPHKSR
ncbi:MAG: hypothetical protein HOL04_00555 [Gammaproteobacteria bacterium]|jgi:hypothetical protein|nr:hypothetical protein [Gammaproteobacteria bacterium]MBT4606172.1 hypothetical protein [Thiotrichales bacterium]MBT3472704.1 hypothetical protein [Gammaproteobacteria bacterium]MBT3968001.1 hypothetical protein [Gammaproteobacteria bacterium]MBT4080995.1 hypothetical protein [Gammaproteobacteria bacterium]